MQGERLAVLAVDDDPAIREVLADLMDLAGHAFLPAQDGTEALRVLATYLPTGHLCAILLDLRLPVMDGLTILERIRAQGYEVPVIVLSAASAATLQAAAGATAVLTKPFDVDALLTLVTQHCPH